MHGGSPKATATRRSSACVHSNKQFFQICPFVNLDATYLGMMECFLEVRKLHQPLHVTLHDAMRLAQEASILSESGELMTIHEKVYLHQVHMLLQFNVRHFESRRSILNLA